MIDAQDIEAVKENMQPLLKGRRRIKETIHAIADATQKPHHARKAFIDRRKAFQSKVENARKNNHDDELSLWIQYVEFDTSMIAHSLPVR